MSQVINAFNNAGITKYIPSIHAIERARLRFGVEPARAVDWINDLMKNAEYLTSNAKNQAIYLFDGGRIVIDTTDNTVITLYNEAKTDFLRPVIEREKRKLYRNYTRQSRKIERLYAESLRELAEMAVNRANARNPKTRELIAERIADKQAEIDGLVSEIERSQDDYKAKIRAMEVISE